MGGALRDVRVLELGDFVAAPYAGKLLADMGADVIKIERPGEGDWARQHGPFPGDQPDLEKSGLFMYLNTNKRGVCLDITKRHDVEEFKRLAKEADVLIEALPPRRAAELGLDYPSLRAVNRRLVVVSITPFGQTGPYRDYSAYALNVSATGGNAKAGVPDREPLSPPLSMTQYHSGGMGAVGAMLALLARDVTGEGQQVDISETDAAVAIYGAALGALHNYLTYSRMRKRSGFRSPLLYPFTILPCKDGYLNMIATQELHWRRFLELVGNGKVPDWYDLNDPRFRDRTRISDETADYIDEQLKPWMMRYTKEELFAMCREKGVPFCPQYAIDEVVHHPHLQERGFFVTVEHPRAGQLTQPGAPYRFSKTPWAIRRPAPLLGEHTEEVLGGGWNPGQEGGSLRAADWTGWKSRSPLGNGRRPLEGVRVLDLSWVLAGPLCARLLGQMGAEVIKVESRRRLDALRLSPHSQTDDPDLDPAFHATNHDKRSVTVDFSNPLGAELVRQMAACCDVVVENFSPRVLPKYGLDYPSLAKTKSDIIMVSLSAAGQNGPLRDVITYGHTLAAIAGIDALVGYAGRRSLGQGGINTDCNSAVHAAFAVLVALWHKRRTGEGQYIDMAQWETSIQLIGEVVMDYAMNARIAGTQGNRHASMAPHNLYRCRGEDAWVAIAVRTEEEWQGLCRAMGEPAWARDPKFMSNAQRLRHQEELDRRLNEWTQSLTPTEATTLLQRHGVAASPFHEIDGLYLDPHFQERGVWVELEHQKGGAELVAELPIRLSSTPTGTSKPAPILGQDNDYLFHKVLGLSNEAIQELLATEAIR